MLCPPIEQLLHETAWDIVDQTHSKTPLRGRQAQAVRRKSNELCIVCHAVEELQMRTERRRHAWAVRHVGWLKRCVLCRARVKWRREHRQRAGDGHRAHTQAYHWTESERL